MGDGSICGILRHIGYLYYLWVCASPGFATPPIPSEHPVMRRWLSTTSRTFAPMDIGMEIPKRTTRGFGHTGGHALCKRRWHQDMHCSRQQQLEWAGVVQQQCTREFRRTATNFSPNPKPSDWDSQLQSSGQGERLVNHGIAKSNCWHWGQGHPETSGNILGTFQGLGQFYCTVTNRHIYGTF